MAKKDKKTFFTKLFFSNYFFVLILLLIFFLGSVFVKKFDENKNIDNDLEDLKAEIESLEKNNDDLGKLIEYFNSNFFVEKEAREKLGLKKDGENVIVVKELSDYENNENVIASNNETIYKSMPLVWWDYFFGTPPRLK